MEENNTGSSQHGHSRDWSGGIHEWGRRHWGYHVARLVLGLILLLMVFGLGLQIGEIKGELGMNRGGMHGYGKHGFQKQRLMFPGGGGMMYYNQGLPQSNLQGTQGVPATGGTPALPANP